MQIEDVYKAKEDARRTINRSDEVARGVARLLAGRLRVADIPKTVCATLKRELRDFNMHTFQWKE